MFSLSQRYVIICMYNSLTDTHIPIDMLKTFDEWLDKQADLRIFFQRLLSLSEIGGNKAKHGLRL